MLHFESRMRSIPRAIPALRTFGFCVAMLLVVAAPGLAQAFSTTSILTDPITGAAVSATFDDAIQPGSVVVSIDITNSGFPGDTDSIFGASLTGFILRIDNDATPPILASGADVFESGYFGSSVGPTCPCYSITDLGSDGFIEPTTIFSTTLTLAQEATSLSLVDLSEATFFVALSVPNQSAGGAATPVKLRGKLPVVPEPTTAVLMLLGLVGLASGSQRLAQA